MDQELRKYHPNLHTYIQSRKQGFYSTEPFYEISDASVENFQFAYKNSY